ncbi:MAG: hypothetical protein HYY13_10930 [Nitrospirae bacterium]|nr:hypothetical protein [Nitrospirota bacterium]
MSKPVSESLISAVGRLLRPLARILVRNGIPYRAFSDLAKRVYVDVIADESEIPGRKLSISRISILTGLSRKEVSRVLALPDPRNESATDKYNRAARVISGWVRDKDFKDERNRPADLSLEGSGQSFSSLVKRYGGDVPARAVLDELLRVGAVEKAGPRAVRLIHHAYIPRSDEAGMLEILGTDVRDLISTIDHNLKSKGRESFFQRKVAYDNLPAEAIVDLRERAAQKGQALLEELDRWLAQHDRDLTPSVSGAGRVRAGIGVYYFEEDLGTWAGSPGATRGRQAGTMSCAVHPGPHPIMVPCHPGHGTVCDQRGKGGNKP